MQCLTIAYDHAPRSNPSDQGSLLMDLMRHISPGHHLYAFHNWQGRRIPEWISTTFPDTLLLPTEYLSTSVSLIPISVGQAELDAKLPHYFHAILATQAEAGLDDDPAYWGQLGDLISKSVYKENARNTVVGQHHSLAIMDGNTDGNLVSIFGKQGLPLDPDFLARMQKRYAFKPYDEPFMDWVPGVYY